MSQITKYPKLLQTVCLLLVTIGAYLYFRCQAAPHSPPADYVFPREPVLKGEYRYEVLEGRRNRRTLVGNTAIICSTFSYYAGTLGQSDGYSNCGNNEVLHGKHVEVYRVRVPQKNQAVGPLVVKIVSEGKVFLDRTDTEVRELWVRDTGYDIFSKSWKLFLVLAVLVNLITIRSSRKEKI